jgi:phosphotransferase system  glucose/maltose/N-acetylglucosamine-specific IIC component
MKRAIALLKESYNKWSEHQAPEVRGFGCLLQRPVICALLVLITAVIAVVFRPGERAT